MRPGSINPGTNSWHGALNHVPGVQGGLSELALLTARMLKFSQQLACDITEFYVILLSFHACQNTELIVFYAMISPITKININIKSLKNTFGM
jgi:hypothetical protein